MPAVADPAWKDSDDVGGGDGDGVGNGMKVVKMPLTELALFIRLAEPG